MSAPPEEKKPGREPVTVTLNYPIQFGQELVEELTIRATAKAFRNFEVQGTQDGRMVFKPYELAILGLAMAGKPRAMVDLMDPSDMQEVATIVLGFIENGRATGGGVLP
jgi:hypothetical protein